MKKSNSLKRSSPLIRFILSALAKQYAAIGGQAVIEGVMMRSPHSFVIAVRTPEGKIRLRKDQWFGLSQKLEFLKKPFLRGILTLVETMANGIVALNWSANIAMDSEEKEKALKKGKTLEEYESQKKKAEKVDLATFLTMALSMAFGIGLFVFLPHALTALLSEGLKLDWGLDSFFFHFVDGLIKAAIFIFYIWAIGFIPDVSRVFQYHGAEHKSISTFEAQLPLEVSHAQTFTTQHPRCGTSFLFFLILISIILFSGIFTVIPVGQSYPPVLRHLTAMLFKVVLMFPVAGVSYEVIKLAGRCSNAPWAKALSYPGMLLQRLTTREPEPAQLEVALASIKAALYLEENFKLREAKEKILKAEEIEISNLADLQTVQGRLQDFLE
jgi:uncharacterized protein YqhQ